MNEEITALYALVVAHKWIPLGALVIGLVVRLLKSDTKIPIDLPPVWRLRTAIALSIAGAVLQRISTGVTWRQAAIEGLFALALAVLGHNLVIDNLRAGKEFAVPLLTKPGTPPGPGKPPSLPPPPAAT